MQPLEAIVGVRDGVARGGGHLRDTAVAVFAVVIGVAFAVRRATQNPALARQAVVGIVKMLRALFDGAATVVFHAADEAAEGVVLKVVATLCGAAVSVGDATDLPLGTVGVGDVSTAIVLRSNQPVKFVVSIGDILPVGKDGFGQVATTAVLHCL